MKAETDRMRLALPSPPADRVWLCHDLGYYCWDVDHACWVVMQHSPYEQDFSGKTFEEALAWCLVWLMFPEVGIGPFLL